MFLAVLSRVGVVVLGGVLRVQSDVACLDANEVSANVQHLLDLSDESATTLRATARKEGDWLVLSLTGEGGSSLGERRLAYDEDCSTLARAAAVVFAAWISGEHPEFLVALPPDESRTQPAEPAEVPPETVTAPSPSALAAVPTAPVPVPSASATAPRWTKATDSAKQRLALGAALGGSATSSFSPGFALSAAWDPGSHGWGARVSAAWFGARSEAIVNAREVSWTRWPLLIGPFLRLQAGRSSFDLEAGAAMAWTRLSGQDFASNATDSGLTAGGYFGLRFVPTDAPLRPFLMAVPVYWLHNATAVATDVSGATVTGDLPTFEMLFLLGAELTL